MTTPTSPFYRAPLAKQAQLAPGDLLALAEKWKTNASAHAYEQDDELAKGFNAALNGCAYELEAALKASAPEAGAASPAAWTRTESICDKDGYPIGTDEPRVSWGPEHPDPSECWFPLYGAPPAPVGGFPYSWKVTREKDPSFENDLIVIVDPHGEEHAIVRDADPVVWSLLATMLAAAPRHPERSGSAVEDGDGEAS